MAIITRHKSTVYGLTNDLLNIQNAAGLDANLNYSADTAANFVASAISVKDAVSKLDAAIASGNGDTSAIETNIDQIEADLGTVSTLTTTSKVAVNAINEHDLELGDISTVAIADGSATDVAGMLNDLEAAKLDKSANLSDVVDVAVARTNIDVDSSGEVDAKINAANLAMGTNHDVATIVERDALTDLDIADRVFVADDGDTRWALYKVAAVDANGTGTAWNKIMDQDALENSISKESIKAAYELNPDTNVFQDAEKVKVGFLSITSARDLDKLIQSDEFITAIDLVGVTDTNLASGLAVKTYVDNEAAKLLEIANNLSDVADVATARTNLDVMSSTEVTTAIGAGGANFTSESVTVATDTITLSNAPKNGVIHNFGCVRHVDVNGVAFDIPTTATADPLVFNIHPDAAGDFDTKAVTVQYAYAT